MDRTVPARSRLPRETRLLLITALMAVVALWVLARVRFPDQPPSPNPVQPILTQLAARPRLDDLAADVARLLPRVQPLFAGRALRVSTERAIVLLEAERPRAEDVLAIDRASGLALIRAPSLPVPPPVPWLPDDVTQPRYLIAAQASGTPATAGAGPVALRPVFVGSLMPTQTAIWTDPVWMLPEAAGLAAGTFVFTTDGLLAGLVVELASLRAILPASVLLAEASRLAATMGTARGYVGVTVQPLTPAITAATGAATGVVVAWVDPDGPAASVIAVGDVLEAANGTVLETPLHWDAQTARARAGSALVVRVRRQDAVGDVAVTAAPFPAAEPAAVPASAPAAPTRATLGLTLRSVPGVGAEVTRVAAGSSGARAGLEAGDVITLVGTTRAPAPAAVREAYQSTADDAAVLVAFTRGDAHAVTALEP